VFEGDPSEADRRFALREAMFKFWQARLTRQSQIQLSFRSWVLLFIWALFLIFALLAVAPIAKATASQRVQGAVFAGLASVVFVWWLQSIFAAERARRAAQFAPVIRTGLDVGADEEDIRAAYQMMRLCGFEFLSDAKPHRMIARMRQTAADAAMAS
jgi:hypothetical protein